MDGAPSAARATQNQTEDLQVLHLPRKRDCSALSAAPATQKQSASIVLNRRRPSADLSEGAQSAAPATQNEIEVFQVLHVLNRCRTSADLPGGAQSPAPATQNEAEVLQVLHLPGKSSRRLIVADVPGAAPSAAPATQNETEVLQVLHLPRKSSRPP